MAMIEHMKLNNQAALVIEEIPYVRSAAVGIFIKVGSRHEPEGMKGASHFIEHMLFKGTPRRTAREIAEEFEGIGGQLNAFTSKEYTCVYARTLDESILTAIDILFDMLLESSFSPRDFETEKGVVVEEINMYEDTPDDLIHDVFAQCLWSRHPMGSPILGTLDSVTGFDRDSVYSFYKQYYVPANMIISVAGNVNKQEIMNRVMPHLENHPASPGNGTGAHPFGYEASLNLIEKDTEQIQICLGVPGISYHDDSRYAQNVLNSIWGGGMSSRLFQKLREELGLAYSVYSSPSNYSDTGSFSIYIGTGPGKIRSCFQALKNEFNDFAAKGIQPEEKERTQKLIKASMYLGLESVMNRMSRLGKSVLMYDRVIHPDDVMQKVFAVSETGVHDLFCDLFTRNAISIAAIGPGRVLSEISKEYETWDNEVRI